MPPTSVSVHHVLLACGSRGGMPQGARPCSWRGARAMANAGNVAGPHNAGACAAAVGLAAATPCWAHRLGRVPGRAPNPGFVAVALGRAHPALVGRATRGHVNGGGQPPPTRHFRGDSAHAQRSPAGASRKSWAVHPHTTHPQPRCLAPADIIGMCHETFPVSCTNCTMFWRSTLILRAVDLDNGFKL